MDKVICDICGTSYPATADQCPICGCEKSAEAIMDEELGLGSDPAPAYKQRNRFLQQPRKPP